jgi:hypothetical protein
MYVRDHRFDQDAMLASVEKIIQSGAGAGYARTKLVGHHMDWLFLDQPAVKNLVEYEARLNGLLSKYDDPVVCNYDSSKFGASVALDILRTHPLVIIGGLLRENPFFVPPEQFLDEMRERQPARTASWHMPGSADPNGLPLQKVLRDLVALSAVPSVWVGQESRNIAADLADLLATLLNLDFAFVRLHDSDGNGAIEVSRGTASPTLLERLQHYPDGGGRLSQPEIVVGPGNGVEGGAGLVSPSVSMRKSVWPPRHAIGRTFQAKSTSCYSPWQPVTARRHLRWHASSKSISAPW